MPVAPSADARFRALFDVYHKTIHAFCLRRLPTEDANEAASEVFVVAWRRSDDLPGGNEARMWLYGIARNVVRNRQRGARRHLRLVARSKSMAEAPSDGPEALVIRNEEYQEVLDALVSLSEAEQELLTLKVWEGLTNEEIGIFLGVSHRAVEGRYARAIRKLSKKLEKDQPAAKRSPFSAERGDVAT